MKQTKPIPPRFWSSIQFFAALGITVGAIGWLLFAPGPREPEAPAKRVTLQDSVQVVGPRTISIATDCPLAKKLESVTVRKSSLHEPLFSVTGRVVASLRPGAGKGNDFWQFDSSEVLTSFSDWQKAQSDIAFTRTQLTNIQELADTRIKSQEKVVARLRKTVAAGTDSEKDLAAEETNLKQLVIQGKKEVYEAETAVRLAQRSEATAARQLQQSGLDPDLLRSVKSDSDIVMAEVPEGRFTQVQVGQSCEARFFGLPDQHFDGKVNRLLPVLSKERRSLRVLFVIHDPEDHIRPGMFAEIGLGTDAREAILVPSDAVIHIVRSDYVIVQESPTNWRVAEVKVGELHGDRVEIIEPSLLDRQILTKGAILLKPPVLLSLSQTTTLAKNGSDK